MNRDDADFAGAVVGPPTNLNAAPDCDLDRALRHCSGLIIPWCEGIRGDL